MTSRRIKRTGRARPVRAFSKAGGIAAAVALAVGAAVLPAGEAKAQRPQAAAQAGQGVTDFYAARGWRPLWYSQPGRQVDVLLEILASAQLDGLNPNKYRIGDLAHAAAAARSGDPRAVRRADMMLSDALVAYVRDLRRPQSIGIYYVDPELRPGLPSARAILEVAARAPSLERYTAQMRWMHPLYRELRDALTSSFFPPEQRQRIEVNLERARELPAGVGRYVVVNAAAQKLDIYENGAIVDSMRVVVGKPKYATPMMTAFIRYAALNPYWNLPADLTAERIAPNVVKQGVGYLREKGYEVLSDWGENPTVVDPSATDWKAVADGTRRIRVRQLPGPENAMGRMKFMFPNKEGVYLHDTPEKELLSEAARLFSGGCVRLEDAPRLARWLWGRDLNPTGAAAEQTVGLPTPIPVYLTYLTAVPSGSQLTFFDDIYGRDASRVAQLRGGRALASSR